MWFSRGQTQNKWVPANVILEGGGGGGGGGVTLLWPGSHLSGSRNSLSHLMLMKPNPEQLLRDC